MATKKKKPKYDRVLAIDLGNGIANIRSIYKDGREYKLSIPSAYGYARDVGNSIHTDDLDLDIYTIDGEDYVWGKDIVKLGNKVVSSYGMTNRYRTVAYRIMARIVMARIVKDLGISANEKILLVTGVPSQETETECENEIYEAFWGSNEGFHSLDINGDTHTFKLADIEVTGQAMAMVFAKLLGKDGNVEDPSYVEKKVVIIDVGAGTTDIDIIDHQRRDGNYTSVQSGFNDIYKAIIKKIKDKYVTHTASEYALLDIIQKVQEEIKAEKTLEKVEEVVINDKSKKVKKEFRYLYQPSERYKPVDFTETLHNAIKLVATQIQSAVMSSLKDQVDIDEIFLIGGSAELFKEYMDAIMDGIEIPEDSGEWNVEGYYRLGVGISMEGDE